MGKELADRARHVVGMTTPQALAWLNAHGARVRVYAVDAVVGMNTADRCEDRVNLFVVDGHVADVKVF